MITTDLPANGFRSSNQDSDRVSPRRGHRSLSRWLSYGSGVAMLLASLTTTAFAGGETFYALSKMPIGMRSSEGIGVSLDVVNRLTGATSSSVGTVDAIVEARGMAMDPTTGTMYVISNNKGSSTDLYTVNLTDATASLVGTIQNAGGTTNPLVRDITFDASGQLWGVTGSQGDDALSILPINKTTAVVGSVLTTVIGDSETTIAYRPVDGLLYVYTFLGGGGGGTGPTGHRFESVDPGTGASTSITLSGVEPGNPVLGLVFDPISDLFRFFEASGDYWTLSVTGTQTDTGNNNGNSYFGTSFDQATTVPVELMSFGVE